VKRIEFIGAPAVGKSTMYREIDKLRRARDKWITYDEARKKIAENMDIKGINLLKLMQICLRYNILKRIQDTFISALLASHEEDIFDKMETKYTDITEGIINDPSVCNYITTLKELRLYKHYYDLLFKKVLTPDYFDTKGYILYDEGLININKVFETKESSRDIFEDKRNYDLDIIPSGVVFCNMEKEKYLQRVKTRIQKGHGTFIETGLGGDLAVWCGLRLESAKNKAQVLKEYMIPVLEIDMSEPIEENAGTVIGYMDGLIKNTGEDKKRIVMKMT